MGDVAQIITSLATLITAIGAVVIGLRNTRVLKTNTQKLDEVHTATNGLTKKLVDLTATSSEAKGNLAGRAELIAEQNGKH